MKLLLPGGGGACGITREWGLRVQSAKIIFCQGAVGQEALSRGGATVVLQYRQLVIY